MICPCGSCLAVIDANQQSMLCRGVCNRNFHIQCTGITVKLFNSIKSVSGLSWRCPDCEKKCFTIDQAGLNALLEEKHSEMLKNLNAIFLTLKTDFIKIAEEKLKSLHLLAATPATGTPSAPLVLTNAIGCL
jgi:hypothetical protein